MSDWVSRSLDGQAGQRGLSALEAATIAPFASLQGFELFDRFPMRNGGHEIKRPVEARSVPDAVWPSYAFYENLGYHPARIKNIGEIQAGAMSAADALGFGLPSAIAKRTLPDDWYDKAKQVVEANPTGRYVGGIGATVLNPANKYMRAPGDILAARGANPLTVAGVDAGVMGAVSATPNVIAEGGLGLESAYLPMTAFANRIFIPQFSPNPLVNAAKGVAAGGVVGFLLGDPLPYAALGGVTAGMMGRNYIKPKEYRFDKAPYRQAREDMITGATAYGGVQAAAMLPSILVDDAKEPKEKMMNEPHKPSSQASWMDRALIGGK